MQENCYQLLGIARTASAAEVRAAFVRLVKRHHPDAANGATMPRRLHDIQAAYRILSDPEARARHDRTLQAAERHHFDRQRAVQRRLRRYDRRHPQRPPRQDRQRRWRMRLAAALVLAVTIHLSLQYLK